MNKRRRSCGRRFCLWCWGEREGYDVGMIRKTVIYSGRVQGVFFRATAREVSHGFDVTGTVRNVSDGTVELVVEGELEEVDRFLRAVERAKAGCIAGTKVDVGAASGEFGGFVVRY